MTKISLGAGTEIEKGWINVDLLDLPGIDVVHDLSNFPWPFRNEEADEIKALDLIEHLPPPHIISFIEECYRILKAGGLLVIRTPRYDAEFLHIDPTHYRGYHERSFELFDPDTDFGKSTGFYSEAKFKVKSEVTENKNLIFTMQKR